MFKWASWVAKLIATALLLSFLSIWTTGYIVNSYMETLLKQLNLPLETQPFALSGVWGRLWGADDPENGKLAEEEPSALPTRQAGASANPETESGGPASDGPSGGASGQTSNGEGEPPDSGMPASADPDSGGPEGDGSEGSPDDGSVPALGGGSGILDMTDAQRELLSEVMAKLNAEQLGQLSGYLENGLTEDEIAPAAELLKPSLTDEEYGQMMELLQSRAVKSEETQAVAR